MKLYILTKEEKLCTQSGQAIPANAFVYQPDMQTVLIIETFEIPDRMKIMDAGNVCYMRISSSSISLCTDIEEAEPIGQSFDITSSEADAILKGELTLKQLENRNL